MGGLNAAAGLGSAEVRQQLLRYVLVGLANTLIAYALYALGLAVGLSYELASLAALVAGIFISFVTQGRLVFSTRLKGRFLLFAATWAVLYLINVVVIRTLNWVGLDLYLAGLAAIPPVTGLAFLLLRGAVFADPPLPTQRLIIIGMLLLLATARLDLALRFEANWDEFLNLAMVHSHGRGELREVLQTAFVHLFYWVPAAAANELNQVIAGRLLVLLLAAITSLAIYRISRRFMGTSAALVAVVAFNGFSFVMRNGNAVRTDPLAACCMMVGIWLAMRRLTPNRAVSVGCLVGLAGALTIKSFFYIPTVGAILLLQIWYSGGSKRDVGLVALSALVALASFLILLALHSTTFSTTASASTFVARTSGATLFSGDYSILLESVGLALGQNLVFWVLLIAGTLVAATMVRNPQQRRSGLTLLSLLLVLASPLIYRDVYPYYYPFMLAPASVVVGFGFGQIAELRRGIYANAAIALLFLSAAITYAQSGQQDNRDQHRTLDLIHRLFPRPVPYIDHTSMVSSYRKQGFFMSRWGMTDYRQENRPIMVDIISRHEPRFLLVTRSLLDVERLDPRQSEAHRYGLLAADVRALQSNYLRYWGPLYLPGMRFQGNTVRPIAIPGRYRLASFAPVRIDGRMLTPGTEIELAKGVHHMSSKGPARLEWAAPPPPAEPPPRQLFRGF